MSDPRDVDPAAPASGVAVPAPRSVIAVIGIDRYRSWPVLSNAVRDAAGASALFAQLGFEPATAPLLDEHATAHAMHKLVAEDLTALRPDDRLIIVYAGHGGVRTRDLGDRQIKIGYLIPVDAARDPHRVTTWVDLDGWLRDISLLPPRHILVILDACHSGIALSSIVKWRDLGAPEPASLPALNGRRSRLIITSALDEQVALDGGPLHGHSLFMGCLLDGLTGDLARGGKRVVTGSELGLYLRRRVESYPGSRQTPDVGAFALDERGEMLIPILGASPDEAPASSPAPGGRARRVLAYAHELWLARGRGERWLLDLDTLLEVLGDVDHALASRDVVEFVDQSAARSIGSAEGDASAWFDFVRRTEAVASPDARFCRLLQHGPPGLRAGAVRLIRDFDREVAIRVFLEHTAYERDPELLRTIVEYLSAAGATPPERVARGLLHRRQDWIVAAWAMAAGPALPAALLLGDDTQFARDLGDVIAGSGFVVIEKQDRLPSDNERLELSPLLRYQVVVVVRGENYLRGHYGHDYGILRKYVNQGGVLFTTPFVAWEAVKLPFFDVLPFHLARDSHHEAVRLTTQVGAAQPGREIFAEEMTFEASFEDLHPAADTTVLLSDTTGTPLYGFRPVGQGECHYLNVCQHHCDRPMASPLTAPALSRAMTRLWRWHHDRCLARLGAAGAQGHCCSE